MHAGRRSVLPVVYVHSNKRNQEQKWYTSSKLRVTAAAAVAAVAIAAPIEVARSGHRPGQYLCMGQALHACFVC